MQLKDLFGGQKPSVYFFLIALSLIFIIGRDGYVLFTDGYLYSYKTIQLINPSQSWLSFSMFLFVLSFKFLVFLSSFLYFVYCISYIFKKI